MNLWNRIPFMRLLIPFMAGIITAVYSGKHFEFSNYIIFDIFILIALFVFINALNVSYAYSWLFGTFTIIILFLCGFRITVLKTDKFKANYFGKFLNNAELFLVKTNEPYLEKEKSYKIPVSVFMVKQNGKWLKTSGNAMCSFNKDSASAKIHYGDVLIVQTVFNEVKPPQNPSEFNYKRFLSFHNIYHQSYITSEKWQATGINNGSKIISDSYALREYFLKIFRDNNISGDEYAVASALVLGYKDQLDQDIMRAYSSAGAIHVLAVSGLHVGIIFLIFNSLLFFLKKFKYGKLIRMILLLLILWFYALLTGLSPSVLRATTMFSFVVIAGTWKYSTNIFNTLAVSCFALLMYNPFLIMETGFQLSFLAVLGIVGIQPWIYHKWHPNNWLLDKIWILVSVSVAAQAATFPLGLLYFHQFPNYFLFSNLVVIPMATLILISGVILLAIGKIPVIGMIGGKVFSGIVWLLNSSVKMIDQTPGSLTRGISVNIAETWLIYFLILLLLLFLYEKQTRYLFASLTAIIILLFSQAMEAHSICKQKSIIIYNIPKTSALDFIDGKETVFLADSLLIHNESKMLFHIKHNWWDRNITNQIQLDNKKTATFTKDNFFMKDDFIQFENKKIVIINSFLPADFHFQNKFAVDYIIISKNPEICIKELQEWFVFKKIIVDSSNSQWKKEQWKKECEELKINFYSVIDSGAYTESW